jgi:ATP-dependent Lhr-like helicase
MAQPPRSHAVLELFHPPVRSWFEQSFEAPTAAQTQGWPAIAERAHTLILAPTGSGKTLTAFLHCLDRLMFEPQPAPEKRCRVLYVSPLKALAVDVERNLRAPLVGIANLAAASGERFVLPEVAIRTGDTPQSERARFKRDPADILITTPESLYLMLTSNVREALRAVDTVIIDEIHALVPTKRGAHLALSLERLEALAQHPIQRIGLSATQRPLDEVARFLGGAEPRTRKPKKTPPRETPTDALAEAEIHDEFQGEEDAHFRKVAIIDAGVKKALELTIEVPVEDMARIGQIEELPSGPAAQGPVRTSIWSAIHPRLVELIRSHTSTLIFVNSRRVAERLAGALNELAGEVMVMAHHGSIARAQRSEIEDNLKAGRVKGLVATSSLELGIDMGAIDLVVQIEAPPTVASGMQRIGRAGHSVGAKSRGILFPKYRADLVACAALARAMHEGQVEATRYPRNPLDILAQQIVAMTALESWSVEALFTTIRQSAPFAELSRPIFEGVLDMLAGRYVSDEFAELRPRVTWDRVADTVIAREGSKRVAIANGGTIPDRGLYGVFLAGGDKKQARVGELDEEMVFECRVGETFILGASTWRIEEISHDKVMVSPAPGQPGKMPFWHGDQASRPLEVGLRIGKMVRELRALPAGAAMDRLVRHHALQPQAAQNLLAYLEDQAQATTAVPDDQTVIIERCRDELGDWRICVLTPLGAQIHAPWAMAVVARIREQVGLEAETMWTNDGFAVRLPESETPPDPSLFLPPASEVEKAVMDALGSTALFAAKFREIASRALLLPKRRPGQRAPLWQQRKRAADLLAVASRYGAFPMLLETYRECLRDVFDMPALVRILDEVGKRQIRVVTFDSQTPSPFASALLFGFVANYIYEGDAPLAERRAQALSIDQSQLRELLGEAELRELLDPDAIHAVQEELQQLDPKRRVRHRDGLHDLLIRIGDLSEAEVLARATGVEAADWLRELVLARRAVPLSISGERRYIAVEDAARYRDGLGTPLPLGLPETLLQPVKEPRTDLVARYARTHAPFAPEELCGRLGLARGAVEPVLKLLVREGRLLEGAFRPGGSGRELCDPEVLRQIRRRSLAKLRSEVEPVEPRVLGRFLASWQGLLRKRSGLDALLDQVERLQGLALPASLLDSEIFPARVEGYLAGDLDALAAAGEVVWVGVEPLGEHDGRVALYLTDHLPQLLRPASIAPAAPALEGREAQIVEALRTGGASFFASIHAASGGGFPAQTVDALWSLAWKGVVTNDTFRALRAYTRPPTKADRRAAPSASRGFRSRRSSPPQAEGRWSLVAERAQPAPTPTAWSKSLAQQLLARYGLVTREVAQGEGITGGFSAVYEVFKALEASGRVRRGYFVAGVGAMQFALPPVLEHLRSLREDPPEPEVLLLAATDPANPYGTLLKWPVQEGVRAPSRTVGAQVILVNGALAAYVTKGGRQLGLFLPENEPERTAVARAVATRLAELARRGLARKDGMLIEEINGAPARAHPLASTLFDAGFASSPLGFQFRRAGPDTGSRPKLH